MAKVGRPTILTKDMQDQMCALLAQGNYLETVCDYLAVNWRNVYQWMTWGEERGEGEFYEFSQAIKKASASAEIDALQRMKEAQQGWQAQAVFLEKRYPRKWGRRENNETTEVRQLKAKWKQMSDTELQAEVKKLASEAEAEVQALGSDNV